MAFYATVRTYQSFFASDGFAEDCEAIRAAYLRGDKEQAIDLVPDAMIDAYCAAGTRDEVRAQLARWDGLLDVKGITPPRHFCPPDAHDAYREAIFDLVGNGG